MPGDTRAGKSTLTLALCLRAGAAYISDDTVWLDGDRMVASGAPLALRAGSPLHSEVCELDKSSCGERMLILPSDLGAAETCHSAVVDQLIFPLYDPPIAQVCLLSAPESFCRLIGSLFEHPSDGEILMLARIAASTPAAAVTFDTVETSLGLLAEVLNAAHGRRPEVPEVALIDSDQLAGKGLREDIRGLQMGPDTIVWAPNLRHIAYLSGWNGQHLSQTDAWSVLAPTRLLDGVRIES